MPIAFSAWRSASGAKRMLFIGSFGGSVPHTRQPRLFISCSDAETLAEMAPYGMRRSGYEGPASFTTFLMAESPAAGLRMASLTAEVPGYLQGANPACIEAVTRRLAKIFKLPLKLDSLRTASTEWELQISSVIENDSDLAEKVHQLEVQYDDDLLKTGAEEGLYAPHQFGSLRAVPRNQRDLSRRVCEGGAPPRWRIVQVIPARANDGRLFLESPSRTCS